MRIFGQRHLLRGSLLLRLIRMLLGRGLSVCRRLSRFRRGVSVKKIAVSL